MEQGDYAAEQAKWKEEATQVVKQQAYYMKRALDNNNLRDALKHSSNMMSELRTSLLSPKNYYELYMHVFDELQHLEAFFREEHRRGRRMLELYELVQHAGNILPRLYLLITVGSVYIKSKEAPAKDILKDLVEMCRGVQHPLRGLFLRNYLTQMAKDKLPDINSEYDGAGGNVHDSVDFILLNFTEMNKLWVRMQHQGPVREREKREKERSELRILVGTNLLRLSQLDGVDLDKYTTVVLPRVLEQVVNCKDLIAQQYLMECIIQVFPDQFHLHTLEMFLTHCTQLQSGVDVKAILISMMDRLANYATQEAELPEEVKVFSLFTVYVAKVIQNQQSTMELSDIIQLQVSLLNFALRAYPDRLDYTDHVLGFCSQFLGKVNRNLDPACVKLVVELLTLPLDAYKSILTVLELEKYPSLMGFLQNAERKKVAVSIVQNVIKYNTVVQDFQKVDTLMEFISPLVKDDEEGAAKEEAEEEEDDEEFEEEQGLVARLLCFLRNSDTDEMCKIYHAAHKHLSKGGAKRMKYTMVPLVFGCLQLVRKVKEREDNEEEDIQVGHRKLFQFVHEIVTTLASEASDQAFRLFLQCAQAADACGEEQICYEFITQSFIIYEEEISDSKAQFAAIGLATTTLQVLTCFGEENYETLATKATQYSAKLLKKPDQCRAVTRCSHLFWRDVVALDAEEPYRDGKRVLECLQRALKIADACKVSNMHVHLFVEILNEYLYYFDAGNEMITTKYLTSLIHLIEEHLSNVDKSGDLAAVQQYYKNTKLHIRFKNGQAKEMDPPSNKYDEIDADENEEQ